jgi:hypothetical protein
MGVGIALGNTVDSVGPALQKGEFVGVSIPIGKSPKPISGCLSNSPTSNWPPGHDVPDSLQSPIRNTTPPSSLERTLGPDWRFLRLELDRRTAFHGRSRVGFSS